MLVLKKISGKKLAIYFFIIAVMLAGTGLMLYQNYRLTVKQPLTIDNQMSLDNIVNSKANTPDLTAVQSSSEATPGSSLPDLNKLKNDGGLDLTIFYSDKFKQLTENIETVREQPESGKQNPFMPN